ncbi:MAG: hypothetical protein KDA42_05180 [Planctomycetales bacterium]|nr:hypothetical protein [Planctomycetales bacterium]
MIDPFRLCVAMLPLAAYFLLLGGVNLRRHPTLLSGSLDLALLCIAVLGLVVVGPLELFMPEAAMAHFRFLFWPMMLSLYGLTASLILLMSRPRLVVYNVTSQQLRPLLSEIATRLDPAARWAGDSLYVPELGIQLRLEEFLAMRNVSLMSNGENQSLAGWRRLAGELHSALGQLSTSSNPRGASLVVCGCVLTIVCLYRSMEDIQALAQGMQEFLRL